MERRKALRIVGFGGLGTALSGCSGILGDDGCGPGDDEIGTLAAAVTATGTANGETASITGEIRAVGEDGAVVDDGTGTARLTNLFADTTDRTLAEGDCVQASGTPLVPADGSDYDVRLLVEALGRADG